MKPMASKRQRCAIYTRKSTEHNLDLTFTSLDAQREACEAYIKSQAHEGWTLVRDRFNDGGLSGASLDRPALQTLLDQIRARRIDIIVVYKVDRLTRSLADFAKLVELFDQHNVSFVSVTQQFNTTTSMGRLTLNVLLSFAQFEREVTSERIRDKIGASKRKGLWVGGVVPLGYQAKDRKITVVEDKARTVRHIFRRYLELGSLNLLLADLRKAGIKTKVRPLSTGRTIGGIPFTRGSLAYFLRNRFYVGQVKYKSEIFGGEQPAILDRKLFEAVQVKLDQQRSNHTPTRYASDSLVMGLIFDDRGNRMTPTHATKAGVRYRYYISAILNQGHPTKAAKVNRVPAVEIEQLIVARVRQQVRAGARDHMPEKPELNDKDLISTYVARVDVKPNHLAIRLATNSTPSPGKKSRQKIINVNDEPHQLQRNRTGPQIDTSTDILMIPWKKMPAKRPREIIPPALHSSSPTDHRPIRAETRAKLVGSIAKGRHWLEELSVGTGTNADPNAGRENCTTRQVNMTISLAFLAPTLVQAALEGRLPRGVGVANLRDAPAEWSGQHAMLGLAP